MSDDLNASELASYLRAIRGAQRQSASAQRVIEHARDQIERLAPSRAGVLDLSDRERIDLLMREREHLRRERAENHAQLEAARWDATCLRDEIRRIKAALRNIAC